MALYRSCGYQKPLMRPDCLLGVVPQPTDSRLSETSILSAETTAAVSNCSRFHLDTWRKPTRVYQRTPLNVPWCHGKVMVVYHVSLATWLLVSSWLNTWSVLDATHLSSCVSIAGKMVHCLIWCILFMRNALLLMSHSLGRWIWIVSSVNVALFQRCRLD